MVEPSPRIRSPAKQASSSRKQTWSSAWPGVAIAVIPRSESPSAIVVGSIPSRSTPSEWSPWEWVSSTSPIPPRSSAATRIASMWPTSSGPGSITIAGSRPTR